MQPRGQVPRRRCSAAGGHPTIDFWRSRRGTAREIAPPAREPSRTASAPCVKKCKLRADVGGARARVVEHDGDRLGVSARDVAEVSKTVGEVHARAILADLRDACSSRLRRRADASTARQKFVRGSGDAGGSAERTNRRLHRRAPSSMVSRGAPRTPRNRCAISLVPHPLTEFGHAVLERVANEVESDHLVAARVPLAVEDQRAVARVAVAMNVVDAGSIGVIPAMDGES
jgi:hypothetical protein